MKKLFLMVVATLFINASFASSTSSYTADDAKIDQLFSAATELQLDASDVSYSSDSFDFLLGKNLKPTDENKQMLAGTIAIVSAILGVGLIVPFHRFIIGTGGQSFKIFALYFITAGGCGVITLVDGVLLLMDGNGNKYIDNPKFIMWSGK
ncbi:MAG: hypothetical protein ACK48W_00565 [Bacteroidota bacterium]|jgi:hypothetical protein